MGGYSRAKRGGRGTRLCVVGDRAAEGDAHGAGGYHFVDVVEIDATEHEGGQGRFAIYFSHKGESSQFRKLLRR